MNLTPFVTVAVSLAGGIIGKKWGKKIEGATGLPIQKVLAPVAAAVGGATGMAASQFVQAMGQADPTLAVAVAAASAPGVTDSAGLTAIAIALFAVAKNIGELVEAIKARFKAGQPAPG